MKSEMEMTLVKPEDVVENSNENEEDHVTNIDEFVVGGEVGETLASVLDLAVGVLEVEGYSMVVKWNSRYGREVAHFVLGNVVIIADYRGTNLLTLEVLPENEAKIVRTEGLKN